MKNGLKIFLIILISLTVGFGVAKFSLISGLSSKILENKSSVYLCPMHPTYTSNKPGDCPICGMKLVKKERKESKKVVIEMRITMDIKWKCQWIWKKKSLVSLN